MKRDVVGAQRLLSRLLTDVQARRAWLRDPAGFARDQIDGAAEVDMIANLSPVGIEAAAMHLDMKRVGVQRKARHKGKPARRLEPVPAAVPGWFVAQATGSTPSVPLVGLGYWPELFEASQREGGFADVWEHRIDDYLGQDGAERLRSRMDESAVVLHSVDLSLGSPETTTDPGILAPMKSMLRLVGARELSDHLAFSRVAGCSLGHFEPIWRVEESLELVALNVRRLQDALGVRVVLENIALMFDPGGEMTTAEFLNELATRTGCGSLLDITNLTLSERNGFCDAARELATLDLDTVVGVHLAGGAVVDGLAYDAHSFPVPLQDLACLERLLPELPHCRSIIIERDGRRDEIREVREDLRRVRDAVRAGTTQV